ncbi:hypothetical protein CWC14_06020 [Pseudoalteromonas sp. S3260]|uniref:hypothetical protein n=1 Tax=Pseudoalteromonas sp. S3260 TaxID=579534 RepID=UPI00110A4EA4|nr:hypothetical protein [Pseudoalteromonas sp. S3260]TMO98728.1 hypothetical protein CWC14_06020 [Pseudoalteromonas sp. S3260]
MILPMPKINKAPLLFSALVVDTKDAERMLIINRMNGDKVAHFKINDGLNTRTLPLTYSVDPNLAVVMFDDDGQFNAAITDNVQAMLINIFSFDINNPQPYEPPVA